MTLHEVELDELGLWKPRSGFFQHEYRKRRARMTLQLEPAQHNAKLAFCTYHNSAYLTCDEIPNSPCCGTEPVLAYDLEEIQAAATVVGALLDGLNAASPEELIALITSLGELARASVAGKTGELPEAPSTAAGADTPTSEQVRPAFMPDASVDGTTDPPAAPPPPAESTPPPPPKAEGKPRASRASRLRQPKPEAAAVAS